MKRSDNIRDYATSAFIKYARLGSPTREQREQQIREEVYRRLDGKDPKNVVSFAELEIRRNKGHLEDIEAVNKTFDMLYGYIPQSSEKATQNGKDIADAVKGVYFAFGSEQITSHQIALRVRYHAMHVPCDERTVYRWLKYARELFALLRGLDVSTEEDYTIIENMSVDG